MLLQLSGFFLKIIAIQIPKARGRKITEKIAIWKQGKKKMDK